MLAIIVKELRCYTNIGKYRRMQLVVLCGFALLLLVGTVEFYTHRTPDVGKETYKLCIIFLFISQFWVPRHAVEVWYTDQHLPGNGTNGALLALSPLTRWKILVGKLSAVVLWTMWDIWLTIPLFALVKLHGWLGGFAIGEMRCGIIGELHLLCTYWHRFCVM